VLTPVQFLHEILDQLDAPSKAQQWQPVAKELFTVLTQFYERGHKVLLVIDEAHLMKTVATLEQVRYLLNWQTNDQFLISVAMIGTPELSSRIAKVPALDQQVAVRFQLQNLSLPETSEMLLHRLRVAGYTGDHSLFTHEAVSRLYAFSHGIPRLSCQAADNALMLGMSQRCKAVDELVMDQAIDEFYGKESAA
jgi:general secretion pathway protein A